MYNRYDTQTDIETLNISSCGIKTSGYRFNLTELESNGTNMYAAKLWHGKAYIRNGIELMEHVIAPLSDNSGQQHNTYDTCCSCCMPSSPSTQLTTIIPMPSSPAPKLTTTTPTKTKTETTTYEGIYVQDVCLID